MRQPSLVPVILCGGIGARLWPLSRKASPKPFQKLTTNRPMLVETLARVPEEVSGVDVAAPVVVAAEAHAALVRGAMMVSDDSDGWVITEPEGKNTAPAIALAAQFAIEQEGEDALLLVLPSDHDIGDVAAFHGAIEAGITLAQGGHLVTFGVKPDRPETGYGYIQPSEALQSGAKVERFLEKPDAARAAELIAGGALWNAGIFLFPTKVLLEELERARPDTMAACRAAWDGRSEASKRVLAPQREAWTAIEGESVDYAVMQETARAAVVPVDMDWSDIGSFATVAERSEADTLGNSARGRAVFEQSQRNLVIADSGRTVTLVGCEDLVVIDTPDAVLVVPKEKAQDVRSLHAHLKAIGRDDLL
ncbi:MAG: sugar phosphate nucleotidyltransferase [Pseudomonadota bacterium]